MSFGYAHDGVFFRKRGRMIRTLRWSFCRLVLAAALVVPLVEGGPCEPEANAQVGTLTLGAFLANLMDQIQQTIDNAKNAVTAVEIEGGNQVQLAISKAQAAYQDSMNMTMDRIDQTTRDNINRLDKLTHDFMTDTARTAEDATRRAQTIVSLLPFHAHQPKVATFSPKCVAPLGTAPFVSIHVSGAFEFASQSGFEPSFAAGNAALVRDTNTQQDLTFELPSAAIKAAANNGFSTIHGTLNLPWKESSGFLGLGSTRRVDKYRYTVCVLPISPGMLTFHEDWTETTHPAQHYRGPSYHTSSQSDGGNDDHKGVPHSDPAPLHCRFVTSTAHLVGSGHGDQSYNIVSVNEGMIQSTSTSIHHRLGESGVNDFWVEADLTCDVDVARHETTTINTKEATNLRWGDAKVFTVHPDGHITVVFDAFDGTHTEWSGQNTSGKYVQSTRDGKQLSFTTIDPARVVWP